ncbi:hypothetical protein FY036_15790 [Mesorhizobium microcysteis]|uniref:Uncharacterized protein n=1 Tax=Neoaquamicrobium microcysteis TaxID=2682781 RepID=A0A5D4GS88_9HYPH|nr:hypothetical protein FY036_15790 [Mesorhizobium microcysteis]
MLFERVRFDKTVNDGWQQAEFLRKLAIAPARFTQHFILHNKAGRRCELCRLRHAPQCQDGIIRESSALSSGPIHGAAREAKRTGDCPP